MPTKLRSFDERFAREQRRADTAFGQPTVSDDYRRALTRYGKDQSTNAFARGVESSIVGAAASMHGLAVAAKAIAGDEDGALESLKTYERLSQTAGRIGPNLDITKVDDLDSAAEFVAGGLGTALTSIATIVGTGGAAGAAAKGAAHAIGKFATRKAAKRLAKGAASRLGPRLGTLAAGVGMETGSIEGELFSDRANRAGYERQLREQRVQNALNGMRGRVLRVVDGDTLDFEDAGTGQVHRIRLPYSNAADKGQVGKEEAAQRLREMVEGKNVFVDPGADQDPYGRSLATVVPEGSNEALHETLLRGGATTVMGRYNTLLSNYGFETEGRTTTGALPNYTGRYGGQLTPEQIAERDAIGALPAEAQSLLGGSLSMRELAVTGAGFGAIAGALDYLPIMRVFNKYKVGDKAKGAIKRDFLKRLRKETLKQAGVEGATESAQTVIERAAMKFADQNKEIFDHEGLAEIASAGAIGVLGGAAVGPIAAIPGAPADKPPPLNSGDPEVDQAHADLAEQEAQQRKTHDIVDATDLPGEDRATRDSLQTVQGPQPDLQVDRGRGVFNSNELNQAFGHPVAEQSQAEKLAAQKNAEQLGVDTARDPRAEMVADARRSYAGIKALEFESADIVELEDEEGNTDYTLGDPQVAEALGPQLLNDVVDRLRKDPNRTNVTKGELLKYLEVFGKRAKAADAPAAELPYQVQRLGDVMERQLSVEHDGDATAVQARLQNEAERRVQRTTEGKPREVAQRLLESEGAKGFLNKYEAVVGPEGDVLDTQRQFDLKELSKRGGTGAKRIAEPLAAGAHRGKFTGVLRMMQQVLDGMNTFKRRKFEVSDLAGSEKFGPRLRSRLQDELNKMREMTGPEARAYLEKRIAGLDKRTTMRNERSVPIRLVDTKKQKVVDEYTINLQSLDQELRAQEREQGVTHGDKPLRDIIRDRVADGLAAVLEDNSSGDIEASVPGRDIDRHLDKVVYQNKKHGITLTLRDVMQPPNERGHRSTGADPVFEATEEANGKETGQPEALPKQPRNSENAPDDRFETHDAPGDFAPSVDPRTGRPLSMDTTRGELNSLYKEGTAEAVRPTDQAAHLRQGMIVSLDNGKTQARVTGVRNDPAANQTTVSLERVGKGVGDANAPTAGQRIKRGFFSALKGESHDIVDEHGNVDPKRDVPSNRLARETSGIDRLAEKLGLKGGFTVVSAKQAIAELEAAGDQQRADRIRNGSQVGAIYDGPDGARRVFVHPTITGPARLEALAHELGHEVIDQHWHSADPAVQEAVYQDFLAWAEQELGSVPHHLNEARPGIRETLSTVEGQALFEEYLANQISRWATTSEKPQGLLAKFFPSLVAKLRQMYKALRGEKYVSQPVGTWLDSLWDGSSVDPDAVASEGLDAATKAVTGKSRKVEARELATKLRAEVERVFGIKLDKAADGKLLRFVREQYRGDRAVEATIYGQVAAEIFADDLRSRAAAFRIVYKLLLSPEDRGVLLKAFTGGTIPNQLRALGYRDRTLKNPDNVAAHAFALWSSGERVNIGPKTRTIFNRVANGARSMLGILTADEQAQQLLDAIATDGSTAFRGPLQQHAAYHVPAHLEASRVQRLHKQLDDTVRPVLDKYARRVVNSADDFIRNTENPWLVRMAQVLHNAVDDDVLGQTEAYFPRLRRMRGEFLDHYNRAMSHLAKEQFPELRDALLNKQRPTDQALGQAYDEVRDLLDTIHGYLKEQGVQMGRRGEYFPWIFDHSYFLGHFDEFANILNDEKYDKWLGGEWVTHNNGKREFVQGTESLSAEQRKDRIETLWGQIVAASGEVDHAGEIDTTRTTNTPFFVAHDTRELFWLEKEGDMERLLPFFESDMTLTMTRYVTQAVKRAEFTRVFGSKGDKLQVLFERARESGATEQDIRNAQNYIQAALGTLGADINPKRLQAQGAAMVVLNWAYLGFATLSSLIDPIGILVRSGDFEVAGVALKAGLREIAAKIKGDETALREMGEMIGAVEKRAINEALNYEFGGVYMQGASAKLNETLFKLNGLTSYTRWTRLMALEAAHRFIKKHVQNPNEHSERYLAELNLDPSQLEFDADGRMKLLDADQMYSLRKAAARAAEGGDQDRLGTLAQQIEREEQKRAALNRFIDESILRPDAAQRPIWASDPHWMLVFHLKGFTYSMYDRILKRIINEAGVHGNYAPLAVMPLYIPAMLASDWLRNLAQGDDDENDDETIGETIWRGAHRASLFGLGTFAVDAGQDIERGNLPASLLGPAAEKMVHLASGRNVDGELAGLLPLQNVWRPALGNHVLGEQGVDQN